MEEAFLPLFGQECESVQRYAVEEQRILKDIGQGHVHEMQGRRTTPARWRCWYKNEQASVRRGTEV